jgi:hypothetical protein
MARLKDAQSPADYRSALNDLRTVVQNGVLRAKQQAAGAGQQTQAPSAAAPSASTGTTSSGISFSVEP